MWLGILIYLVLVRRWCHVVLLLDVRVRLVSFGGSCKVTISKLCVGTAMKNVQCEARFIRFLEYP